MEHYYTPDAWPAVQKALAYVGVTNYQRMRLDLADLSAGWQPITDHSRSIAGEVRLINRTLTEHKIDAQIDPQGILDPGSSLLVYSLLLGKGVRINLIEQRLRELANVISNYRQVATPVRLRQMPLALEVPHFNHAPLPLPASLSIVGKRPHTMTLGMSFDYKGDAIEQIDLQRSAHLLLAGTTGSGKSTLLASALLSLCWETSPADLEVILIDMKNEDLVPFVDLPHVTFLATSAERAQQAIGMVYGEKERRVEDGRGHYRRMLLVIDELAELNHIDGAMRSLGSILAIGRSKAINVVAATQKPTAAVVGSVTKANFTTRLVGRVLSADDSRVASGQPRTGAELLPGNGAFLRVDGADVRRIQGYFVDTSAIERHIAAIAQRWQRQGKLV